MHEQENAKVKGKGGAIGLTENQVALQRWMICGPEIAKCLSEFESEGIINESIQTDCHHEEGLATPKKFQEQVKSLLSVITTFGNPFEDNCPELLVLNSRNCVHEAVIETVQTIEMIAKKQYRDYVDEVISRRTRSIHDTIKKNNLPLFKRPKPKAKSKSSQQLAAQRNNASLFGRLYIANQQRDGDLGIFFSHENQCFPPSLSDFGNLRLGQKSALLACLNVTDQPTPPLHFHTKVFDGSAIVHFLPTVAAKTFAEYADNVFLPFILHHLEGTNRIDFVWDRYIASSLKELTRIHRGSGLRTKVSGQAKLPRKWNDARNKKELYDFLTDKVKSMEIPENKEVFITSEDRVFCKGMEHEMPQP